MQLSAQPASLLDDINEMDTEDDDEYDEIAKIIDTYDEEQNSCDAKSDHVKDMLNALINDTDAYLNEQDSVKGANDEDEDPAVELSGKMSVFQPYIFSTNSFSELMSNLHLGGGGSGNKLPKDLASICSSSHPVAARERDEQQDPAGEHI